MLAAELSPPLQRSRRIEALVAGYATSDGAGVRLTRLLTQKLQRRLDPFLMLDAFGSDDAEDYIAGFPDHPHRGFETITYMLDGRMRHRDSAGHEGVLGPGGVQWMTAGRGVIHSEIPEQTAGRMEGFQLWLNLPAADKMCVPWYRDFAAAELPAYRTAAGAAVTVIAGTSRDVQGAVSRPQTQPLYLDIALPAGVAFEERLAAELNAFIVVYRGAVTVADEMVTALQLGVLDTDPAADGVRLLAREDSRLLLVAGKPLQEPIVQHGPFVMNDEQEIYQAISDYRQGRLGV
ncbi:pirin family protein [Azonexus hydrophilus]|uniref:pirin family protein n=1 Tax=Azonexus hydrophilus TaxID=418702 RepID=UPI001962B203|nr:pirin family protein [Azonexus hydrophilus]